MKIVTWNCRGGFHRKVDALRDLNADLMIVEECASPERWLHLLPGCSVLWHGAGSPIGVAVIAAPGIELEWGAPLSMELRLFVPARVGGDGAGAFGVLGAWTKQGLPGQRSYIGQLYHAFDLYTPFLAAQPCFVAGDLNSNAIWDKGKPWNHRAVAARLEEMGMCSLYHQWYGEVYGEELLPTYRHNTGQPFHLDYIFAPTSWLPTLRTLAIGGDEWLRLSDHRPLIAEFAR